MGKTAYLFPGQGSQSVGMGKHHFDTNSTFKALMSRANDILGYDLSAIMFEGPEETLRQTEHTQPAIFVHSVALFKAIDEYADMVAGHSLGEFSALVACEAVAFEDALRIVRRRGQLMQEAGAHNPGTMAAVIGMDDAVVEDICAKVSTQSGKTVVAANYNSPGQVVISGHEEAIDAAIVMLKESGCRIAKKLPVSGAFHSPLMKPAYDGLKQSLETLRIDIPRCPIYSNFTAVSTTHPETIRQNLLSQLMNPVRWTQTLHAMAADGAASFVEVGPGNVLQGLVKRTLPEAAASGFA